MDQIDNEISKSKSSYDKSVMQEMDRYAKSKYGKNVNQIATEAENEDWSDVDKLRGDWSKYSEAYEKKYENSNYKKLEDIEWHGEDWQNENPDTKTQELMKQKQDIAKDYVDSYIKEHGQLKYSELEKSSRVNKSPEHPGYKMYKDAESIIENLDWNSFEFVYDSDDIIIKNK